MNVCILPVLDPLPIWPSGLDPRYSAVLDDRRNRRNQCHPMGH
jgi:hypothetical protein